jgi:hypothetical protein
MPVEYKGTDKTIKRIHDNLNKIEWIFAHKKPWSKKAEKAATLEEMMGGAMADNPFGEIFK